MKSRVKCLECGAPMKETRETRPYDLCGLKNVILHGVVIRRCTRCENDEIGIPRTDQLHRMIARAFIEKETRLTGDEVRFLRKTLGWSGADFAGHMGVAEETVSRWENDAAPIGPQADRLLRLIVAQDEFTARYPTQRLCRIDPKKAKNTRLELKAGEDRWKLLSA